MAPVYSVYVNNKKGDSNSFNQSKQDFLFFLFSHPYPGESYCVYETGASIIMKRATYLSSERIGKQYTLHDSIGKHALAPSNVQT